MEETQVTQEQQQNPDNSSEEEISQVQYNLSSFKIMHIADLIRNADFYYLKGLVTKAFFNWKCVFLHIRSRLNKKEIAYSQKIRYLFYKNRGNLDLLKKKAFLSFYYEKYENHLQNMLKKYGYDMKEKEITDYAV